MDPCAPFIYCPFKGQTAVSPSPCVASRCSGLRHYLCSTAPGILPGRSCAPSCWPFRRRFVGATLVFYLAIASLIMPGLLVGLGIGLMCQLLGLQPAWYTSALGAQLTWTLPFGLLIMFAVLSRFNRFYEEAARDLGASAWQTFAHVILPILLPGIIAVALFGFTLSYDEFARTLLTVGPSNTLPLEIWAMTTNITSPALYALGTLTTVVSFVVITVALTALAVIQRRRAQRRRPHMAATR
jgi:putative spermidine/putrescine transport system permease protein